MVYVGGFSVVVYLTRCQINFKDAEGCYNVFDKRYNSQNLAIWL